MCLKKKPFAMRDERIERAGADKLFDYQDAGVKLQNAGASLFSHSGAQAILPDGTKTPIFKNKSNDVEKQQLLAYLEANHSDILNQASATELGEDKTTVTKDEETGDVTVSVETVNGETGQKTFEAADTETVEGLNDAIAKMQAELDALKGEQAAAQEAAVAAALAAQNDELEAAKQAEADAKAALEAAKTAAEKAAAEKAAEEAAAAAAQVEEDLQNAAESGAVLDTKVDSVANKAYVDAAIAEALKDITTESGATQFSDVDVLTEGESTLLDPDIKTLDPVSPVGITSVVYKTIVEREPSEAVKLQEQIAREELRRARVDRAIQKRSLMRRRIEASAQVGAGRIVRSGQEVELDIGEPTAAIARAAGMRGGRGRGSLITGSRGGIGFYSRFS